MAFENKTGLGVHTWYGPRTTAVTGANKVMTKGAMNEVVLDITGYSLMHPESVQAGITIPAGALVHEAFVECEEAFTLGAAKVNVGTKGSAATNGIEINTGLGAVGAKVVTTKKGTYNARLADASEVFVEASGTTSGITEGGKGRVVVRYFLI